MKQIPAIFSLLILLISCNTNDDLMSDLIQGSNPGGDVTEAPVSINPDHYRRIENALYSENPLSDPYTILSFERVGTLLFVEVQYAGGCEKHNFALIGTGQWYDQPDIIPFLLVHDANGDLCEALITETLVFDFSIWDAAASNPDFHRYRIINASDAGNQKNDRPSITVTQSENCVENVTAEPAICGIGLYDNLWLKLDNGDFLQPVGIADAYKDFVIEEGKRYRVGVTILDELPAPYNMMAVCAGWPGPNEPAYINCIEEITD